MHLGFNNQGQVYSMGGQALEETTEERDIGVEMTKNLKHSSQCTKAARILIGFHFPGNMHVINRNRVQHCLIRNPNLSTKTKRK
jgi:hypothetical protein